MINELRGEIDEKPPSKTADCEGDCSTGRYHRVGTGDLHWLPIWRGGNLPGLAVRLPVRYYRLQFNKTMDMGNGATY